MSLVSARRVFSNHSLRSSRQTGQRPSRLRICSQHSTQATCEHRVGTGPCMGPSHPLRVSWHTGQGWGACNRSHSSGCSARHSGEISGRLSGMVSKSVVRAVKHRTSGGPETGTSNMTTIVAMLRSIACTVPLRPRNDCNSGFRVPCQTRTLSPTL